MSFIIHKEKATHLNYTIDIVGDIDEFSDYEELFKLLNQIQTEGAAHIDVYVNSPGGSCDVGFHIINKLLRTPCPVSVTVEGPSASMGAILALSGDTLNFLPDTYLMFHDYSMWASGKGSESVLLGENYRKFFKSKFERICKPFLTSAECARILRGEDFYIHFDDPSLPDRINRHQLKRLKVPRGRMAST